MPSLGWQDPIWTQLYTGTVAPSPPPPAANRDDAPLPSYLDQLQAAAAAGKTLNLSDLPGYQTNLQGGGDA